MSDTIRLYDFGRRGDPNTCWSYHVWKTRLALNYKQLPYTTVWVDHDTLGPTMKSIGLPPNTSGQGFEYTVPTIDLHGSITTDSAAIIEKLEALQPLPSLHLDVDLQATADHVVRATIMPLFPIYMPRLGRDLISESTIATFMVSREKRFGVSLEEMEKTKGGEQAWEAARPGFDAMQTLLHKHKKDEGPFILGSQVCYADFILVALFEAFRQLGEDMFKRAVSWDPRFGALYQASQQWLANDR